LSENSGNTINDIKQYDGILLENHVASILFNFTQRGNDCFTLYYDANKKRNVDFILQRDFKNPVPIEVGRGRKKIKNKSLMQSTVMVQIMELSSQILQLILKNTIILSMFLQKHFHFYNWLCSKIHRFLMKLLLKDLSFLLK